MSPSESQLRAALHEGEGDALDAGLLIAHAHRVHRERRQRVNRLAGATLVVGLLGGGLMLLGGGSKEEGGGSSADGTALSQRRGSSGEPHAANAPASEASSSQGGGGAAGGRAGVPAPAGGFAATCPPVPDRVEIPTSYAPQGAYRAALFPPGTSAIRACAYPGGALHRTVVLQAGAARAFASTVNAAATRPTPSKRTCTRDEPAGTVELLPFSRQRHRAKPVVVTITCPNAIATNGVVIRYFVVAPKLLSNLLR